MMIFWENVKTKLKENKTTQAELAEKLGVNFKTFQGWLTRNFALDILTAKQISEILGCTVDSLITGDFGVTSEENQLLTLYRDIPEACKPMLMNQAEQLASLKDKMKD